MSFFPGDPKRRFPHPANSEVLAALEATASPPPADLDDILFEIDDYELHTHPDLYDRLFMLSKMLPELCFSAAFGCSILVTSGGVIFAVARGTSDLAFRLPADAQPTASELHLQHRDAYGLSWPRFYPLHDNEDWCKRAYFYGGELE